MSIIGKLAKGLSFVVIGVVIAAVLGVLGAYAFLGLRWDALKSDAMAPHYSAGAAVVTLPASKYEVGDDITFRVYDAWMTRRIHAIDANGTVTTKATNWHGPDDWQVSESAVRGKVVLVIPHGGEVTAWMQSHVLLLCAVVIAFTICAVIMCRPIREADEYADPFAEE